MPDFSPSKTYALFSSPANMSLIADLEKAGGDYHLFANIETNVFEAETKAGMIQDLSGFDWVIFTDIYTVDYLLEALNKAGVDRFVFDNLHVCAMGESVADRLRFSLLHADVMTRSVGAYETVTRLTEYLSTETMNGIKVLVVTGNVGKPDLLMTLEVLEADAVELPIYNVDLTEDKNLSRLKALLRGGAVDEFIFTSPADVLNLSHIFREDALEEVLEGIALNAVDNATLQSLREFRLVE